MLWRKNLHAAIMKVFDKFTNNIADPTLYFYRSAAQIVRLIVNTDDCLLNVVMRDAKKWAHKFLKDLNDIYELTYSENINIFLGLQLTWATDKSWVKITVKNKIEELIYEISKP